MHHAVFLDAATMGDANLTPLANDTLQLTCYDQTATRQVVQRLAPASIAIVNKVQLTGALLQQLPRLKLICVAATGVNNVDTQAAKQLGIVVCNVRSYANTAVAQHVFAMLLQLSNKIQQYHRAVLDGRWSQSPHFCLLDYPVSELAGKNFAVIGYGELGQASARLAHAFGMNVLIAEHAGASRIRAGRVAFLSAIAQADVISLHCPLTASTEQLFNRQLFAALKTGAILLNTARGGLIDPAALIDALKSGQLAGAALDVLPEEPPAADNLLLGTKLPNLIITPHIAWASAEARQRMVLQLKANIVGYINGQVLNQV
jgi:glycerate dehydrogenase